jgi:hypothetical protein
MFLSETLSGARRIRKKAKIIDFGRAEFSDNLKLLEEQVETLKYILEMQ